MSAESIAKGSHIFSPRSTYRITWQGGFGGGGGGGGTVGANPPAGAIVYYWLKQPAKKLTLEFRDSTGRTIRSFTNDTMPAVVAPAGGRGGGDGGVGGPPVEPKAANKVGLNSFAWNLREADATRFDGMIFWAGGTNGPLVIPGTYTARLIVDGGTPQDAKFIVMKDPRTKATQADLIAQYKLLMQVRDRTTDANDAVRTVRWVRAQLAERMKDMSAADSAEFRPLAAALDAKITEVEAEVYQVKNQSGQDPLNYPIKVNNQIAAMAGVIGSTEAKPTKQSAEVFGLLTKELEGYLVELRKAWKELLPPVDAYLIKKGKKPIDVKPNDVRAPRPIGGGGDVTGEQH